MDALKQEAKEREAKREALRHQLKALIDAGLEFNDCTAVFAETMTDMECSYSAYAAERHGDEVGHTRTPLVVAHDPKAGAQVLTWTWIDAADVDEFEGDAEWRGGDDDEDGDDSEPVPGM